MHKIFVILFCFIGFIPSAQENNMKLEGAVQAGLLEGEKGSAVQFGLLGGVKLRTWTASLGAGLDYYGIRSIPAYINVQKRLFNSNRTPFLYLGGGYHFPWIEKNSFGWTSGRGGELKGGLFYHAGIGYQLPVVRKAALFFAAGYSYKQYAEEFSYVHPCLVAPCPEYKEKIEYRLRRLSVTTGLRF